MTRPVRTCVGCRTRRPQAELVRVAAAGDGDLVVDRTAPGRGAWLCTESVLECCDLAVRRKGFSRALRRDIEAAAVDRLRSYLTTRARL